MKVKTGIVLFRESVSIFFFITSYVYSSEFKGFESGVDIEDALDQVHNVQLTIGGNRQQAIGNRQ